MPSPMSETVIVPVCRDGQMRTRQQGRAIAPSVAGRSSPTGKLNALIPADSRDRRHLRAP